MWRVKMLTTPDRNEALTFHFRYYTWIVTFIHTNRIIKPFTFGFGWRINLQHVEKSDKLQFMAKGTSKVPSKSVALGATVEPRNIGSPPRAKVCPKDRRIQSVKEVSTNRTFVLV